MSSIRIFNNMSNLDSFESFSRFVSAYINELTTQVNGKLDFISNIRASGPFVIGFTNASNIRGVTHSLGFVPQGFLVINQTASASIYQPQGASYGWTDSLVYLQASAGVTASLYII